MHTGLEQRFVRSLAIATLFAVSVTVLPARAQNVPPDVLVRDTTEEVLSIVRADKEIREGKTERIVQLIEEKVAPHFDFARMTRLAVGRPWREATPEQRDGLVGEFRTLLVRSYAAAFTAYLGIAVEYRPHRMNPGDTETAVQTLIKMPGGAQPMSVDYDMTSTPNGWKVYDVRVAGASLIINYRNLFAQEIQNGGIEGLLRSLSDKNSGRTPTSARQ